MDEKNLRLILFIFFHRNFVFSLQLFAPVRHVVCPAAAAAAARGDPRRCRRRRRRRRSLRCPRPAERRTCSPPWPPP
jgi:hypothetical protein